MVKHLSAAAVIGSSILVGGVFSQGGVPVTSLRTPLDYGAVGDGLTNDTAAVQRAIDATQNGGSLYFPGGFKFLVSGLTATGEIHWQGPGGSWLRDRAPNGAVIILGDNATGDLLTLDRAVDSSISGIAFDGNIKQQTRQCNGIKILNCEFTRLDNVYVTSCSGNGIVFETSNTAQTSDEIDLVDCYSVLNGLDGVNFGFESPAVGAPGDCEIIGGHYDYNSGNGVALRVSTYTGICDANILSNRKAGIAATYCTGLNISSNMIRNNLWQGIVLGTGSQYTECTDCSISGNQVHLNSRETAGKYAEIDVGFGSINTRIVGNYCGDIHAGSSYPTNAKCGIWLHGAATHTVVVGNACPTADSIQGGLVADAGATYSAVANVGVADTIGKDDGMKEQRLATNGRLIGRVGDWGAGTLWLGLTGVEGGTVDLLPPRDLAEGRSVVIKDEGGGAGAHNVIVSSDGAKIDGQPMLKIDHDYGSVRLRYDGTAWWTW